MISCLRIVLFQGFTHRSSSPRRRHCSRTQASPWMTVSSQLNCSGKLVTRLGSPRRRHPLKVVPRPFRHVKRLLPSERFRDLLDNHRSHSANVLAGSLFQYPPPLNFAAAPMVRDSRDHLQPRWFCKMPIKYEHK